MKTDVRIGYTPLINWDNFWLWCQKGFSPTLQFHTRTDPWSYSVDDCAYTPLSRIWDQ